MDPTSRPILQLKKLTGPWSGEELAKAMKMNEAGKSYSIIAKKLNRSLGSVAGSLYRAAGYIKGKKPANVRPKKVVTEKILPPQCVKQPRIKQHHHIAISTLEAKTKQKRIRLRLVESQTEVTFAELQPHHCRWPYGDPKQSDFRFCGCDRLKGMPYCEKHTVEAAPR